MTMNFDTLLDKIRVNLKPTAKEVRIINRNYNGVPFSLAHYHQIDNRVTSKKLVFIDGGQAEILSGSFLNIALIRICSVIFQDNERKASQIQEYSLLTRLLHASETNYMCELYDKNGKIVLKIQFPAYGSEGFISSMDKIICDVRREMELQLINSMTDKLSNGDIIVLDGSLRTQTERETEILEVVEKKCIEKDILLTALSKTSGFYTNIGSTFNYYLSQHEGKWYYYPSIKSDEHNVEFYFVKLHPKSDYVFTFELSKVFTNIDISKVLGVISLNSRDPVFLGYPYGLIVCDKFARVSNQEKEYYYNKLLLLAKKQGKDISKLVMQNNAHEKLDIIK